MKSFYINLPVAGALLAGGCMVGPDYKRPAAVPETPAAYAGWKVAEPQAQAPRGRWWEAFGDPELNRLETAAAAANQELKLAVARLDQARAAADAVRSGLFPNVNFAPSLTRERDSYNRPQNGSPALNAPTYNTTTIPFNAGYELDLWGRVRRNVEAAEAQVQAGADDLEAFRLTLQAEVAADYFALRAFDAELALLRDSVEVFRRSLELTRNRRAGGIATDLDVAQAETLLTTTEAQLPAAQLQRAQLAHALATLTGRPASSFAIAEQPLVSAPPVVPPGVPSQLLERRPDIAAAERRMASANAGIGVARAAYFPSIRLDAALGVQSIDTRTLLDASSRTWAVGPSLDLPLFDAGLRRANLRQARNIFEQTVAAYRQTVLNAFADVEDNLSAQALLAEQYDRENIALTAARRQLEIATNRYQAGLVTYLDVAVAQNAALNRQQETVRLRGQQLVASVALIKALGGGWQAPPAK